MDEPCPRRDSFNCREATRTLNAFILRITIKNHLKALFTIVIRLKTKIASRFPAIQASKRWQYKVFGHTRAWIFRGVNHQRQPGDPGTCAFSVPPEEKTCFVKQLHRPSGRKPKCLPRLPRLASRSCHGSTLLIYKQSSGEPVSFNIFLSGASCRTCVVSDKAPTSRGSVFGSSLAGHGDFIASRKMFEGNWSAEVRQDGLRRGDRQGPEGGGVYNLLFSHFLHARCGEQRDLEAPLAARFVTIL